MDCYESDCLLANLHLRPPCTGHPWLIRLDNHRRLSNKVLLTHSIDGVLPWEANVSRFRNVDRRLDGIQSGWKGEREWRRENEERELHGGILGVLRSDEISVCECYDW